MNKRKGIYFISKLLVILILFIFSKAQSADSYKKCLPTENPCPQYTPGCQVKHWELVRWFPEIGEFQKVEGESIIEVRTAYHYKCQGVYQFNYKCVNLGKACKETQYYLDQTCTDLFITLLEDPSGKNCKNKATP